MLIRIKNASRAGQKETAFPYSDLKMRIAGVLMKAGYLSDVQRKTRKHGKKTHKRIEVTLVFSGRDPRFHDTRRISKQSRRIYVPKTDVRSVKNGFGIAILTTSKGVMTDKDARMAGIGGEVIAEVW